MTTITREDVIRAAKELIAENGEDYVYPGAALGSCSYSAHNDYVEEYDEYGAPINDRKVVEIPACLVGQIAERIDPNIHQELIRYEGISAMLEGISDFKLVHRLRTDESFDEMVERMTPEAREDYLARKAILETGDDAALTLALLCAQRTQDDGKTWGEAVKPILALEV